MAATHLEKYGNVISFVDFTPIRYFHNLQLQCVCPSTIGGPWWNIELEINPITIITLLRGEHNQMVEATITVTNS